MWVIQRLFDNMYLVSKTLNREVWSTNAKEAQQFSLEDLDSLDGKFYQCVARPAPITWLLDGDNNEAFMAAWDS